MGSIMDVTQRGRWWGLGVGDVRLSCTRRELVVPVSHHGIFYGEPKLHSVPKYCGKLWSLVLSHSTLTDTRTANDGRRQFGCLHALPV